MTSVSSNNGTFQGNVGSTVNVAVRFRPLIDREVAAQATNSWTYDCRKGIIQGLDSSGNVNLNSCYVFDNIFGSSSTNSEVYKTVVEPFVDNALHGFHGTVFCYGQTSSGKTYTLYGSDKEPGLISLCAQDLFNKTQEDQSRHYLMRVSLLEIYNEKVTDLLNSENPIDLVEQNGEVVPKDLQDIQILKPQDLLDAAKRVQRERKIGETRMNKESSRSHTILRIAIESVPADDVGQNGQMTSAILSFIDLAGSEKSSQTGATGQRFKEAININKSLLFLSNVIKQLSEEGAKRGNTLENTNACNTSTISTSSNSSQSSFNASAMCSASASAVSKAPKRFINYRDSKLTRLLQSSLSGNAYISIICNVTPVSVDETKSTLGFAKTAKTVYIKPQLNQIEAGNVEYEARIQELKNQLSGKNSEVVTLKRKLEAVLRYYHQPPVFSDPAERRLTCLPEILTERQNVQNVEKRYPKNTLPNRRFSLSTTNEAEKFLSQENAEKMFDALELQRCKTIYETPIKSSSMKTTSCSPSSQVEKQDQEAQTSFCETREPDDCTSPKRPRLDDTFCLNLQRELHSELLARENENTELKSFIQHEKEMETEELLELRAQIDRLKAEVEEEKKKALNSVSVKEELEFKLQFAKDKLKDFQEHHDKTQSTLTEVNAKVTDLEKTLETTTEEKVALQQKLESLELQYEEDKSKAKTELQELSDALKLVNDSMASDNSKQLALQEENEQLKTQMEEITQQTKQLEETMATQKSDIENALLEKKECLSKLEALQGEKAQLEGSLKEATEERVNVQKKLLETKKGMAHLEELIEKQISEKQSECDKNSELQKRCDELEQLVQNIKAESSSLEKQLEEALAVNDRYLGISEENDFLKDELDKLRNEKRDMQETYDEELNDLKMALKQKNELEDQDYKLNEQLNSLRKENEQIENNFRETLEKLETVQQSLAQIENEKNSWNKTLANKESELQSVLLEKAELEVIKEEKVQLEFKIGDLTQEMTNLKTSLAEAVSQCESLELLKCQLADKVKEMETTKTELEVKKIDSESQCEDLKTSLAQVKEELEKCLHEKKGLKENYMAKLSELEALLKQKDEREDMTSKFAEELASLKGEKLHLEEDLKNACEELETMKSSLLQLEEEKTTLSQALAEKESELQSALMEKAELETMQQEKLQLDLQLTEVSNEMITLRASLAETEDKLKSTETEKFQLAQKLETVESSEANLQALNLESCKQIELMNESLTQVKEELDKSLCEKKEIEKTFTEKLFQLETLLKQKEEHDTSSTDVNEQLVTLKTEKEHLMIDLKNSHEQLESMKTSIMEIENEKNILSQTLQEKESEMQSILMEKAEFEVIKEEKVKLEFQLEDVTHELTNAQASLSEVENRIESVETEKRQLAEKLTEFQSNETSLQVSNQESCQRIEHLEETLKQLKEELEKCLREKMSIEENYTTKLSELETLLRQKDENEDMNLKFSEELSNLKAEKNQLENNFKNSVDQLEAMKSSLLQLEEEKETLSQTLAEKESELQHSIMEKKSEFEKLQQEKLDLNTHLTQMSSEMTTLKTCLTEAENKLNSIETEKHQLVEKLEQLENTKIDLEVAQQNSCAEVEELKKLLADTENSKSHTAAEVTTLKSQIESLNEKNKVLQQRCKELETSIEHNKNSKSTLEKSLSNVETNSDSSNDNTAAVEGLKKEIESKTKYINRLKDDIRTSWNDNEKLKERIEELTEKLNNAKSSPVAPVIVQQQTRGVSFDEFSSERKKVKNYEIQVESLKKQLAETQKHFEEKHEEFIRVNKELISLRASKKPELEKKSMGNQTNIGDDYLRLFKSAKLAYVELDKKLEKQMQESQKQEAALRREKNEIAKEAETYKSENQELIDYVRKIHEKQAAFCVSTEVQCDLLKEAVQKVKSGVPSGSGKFSLLPEYLSDYETTMNDRVHRNKYNFREVYLNSSANRSGPSPSSSAVAAPSKEKENSLVASNDGQSSNAPAAVPKKAPSETFTRLMDQLRAKDKPPSMFGSSSSYNLRSRNPPIGSSSKFLQSGVLEQGKRLFAAAPKVSKLAAQPKLSLPPEPEISLCNSPGQTTSSTSATSTNSVVQPTSSTDKMSTNPTETITCERRTRSSSNMQNVQSLCADDFANDLMGLLGTLKK